MGPSSLSMAAGWHVEENGILYIDQSKLFLKGCMLWNTEDWVALE
jgi:hypothetical protein